LPNEGDLDLSGLDISSDNMKELMGVDKDAWKEEIPDIDKHFSSFGDRFPERLKRQLQEFIQRLG
jgi:phosphoenolpyruvate carboxykinase (GTP)